MANQTYTILHPSPGMAHNIMSSFKTGSVVVVSNPHPDSFAYRGTIGKVVSVRNGKITIKSDNGYFSTWQEKELLYLHD